MLIGRLCLVLVFLLFGAVNLSISEQMCGVQLLKPDPQDDSPPEIRGVGLRSRSEPRDLLQIPPLPEEYENRSDDLQFKIKLWQSFYFNKKMAGNEKLKTQFDYILPNVVQFFDEFAGVKPHEIKGFKNLSFCNFQTPSPKISDTKSYSINITGYDLHLVLDLGSNGGCVDENTGRTTNVLAWAIACSNSELKDQRTGRSLVGLIYFCKNLLLNGDFHQIKIEATLKHEIFHILGMDSTRVRKNYHSKVNSVQWNSAFGNHTIVQRFNIMQRVKEEAEKHFNCPNLFGAELETFDGEEESISHWDKRTFGPEIMTSTVGQKTYLSRMTLAYLWSLTTRDKLYKWYPWINVTKADRDYWYGKNYGCTFVKGSCRQWIHDKPMEKQRPLTPSFPFCSAGNVKSYLETTAKYKSKEASVRLSTCSPDLNSVLHCCINTKGVPINQKNKKTLYYDNLHGSIDPGLRGCSQNTEFCPVYSDTINTDEDHPKDSNCLNPNSKPRGKKNIAGECFGLGSICVQQHSVFTRHDCTSDPYTRILFQDGRKPQKYSGAGCYKYFCEDGRLFVQAVNPNGAMKYFGKKVCWSEGNEVFIRRMVDTSTYIHGSLICPSCQDICPQRLPGFKCLEEVYDVLNGDPLVTPCTINNKLPTLQISYVLLLFYSLIILFDSCV